MASTPKATRKAEKAYSSAVRSDIKKKVTGEMLMQKKASATPAKKDGVKASADSTYAGAKSAAKKAAVNAGEKAKAAGKSITDLKGPSGKDRAKAGSQAVKAAGKSPSFKKK